MSSTVIIAYMVVLARSMSGLFLEVPLLVEFNIHQNVIPVL